MAELAPSLSGRCVVVTRPRAQSGELCDRIEALGASVIEFPTIKISAPENLQPLRQALKNITAYDWLLLTSTNAVDALVDELGSQTAAILDQVRIATVGGATERKVHDLGVKVDFVPSQYNFACLCKEMVEAENLQGAGMLYPCSDLVQAESSQPLNQAGATVELVVAYRTLPDDSGDVTGLQQRLKRGEVDAIIFASPSAARNFFARIEPDHLPDSVQLVSIGPKTTSALQSVVSQDICQAGQSDVEGIVEILREKLINSS